MNVFSYLTHFFNTEQKIYNGVKFNEKYPNTEFYKIINNKLIHNNFEFKHGLNIDTIPFNPKDECSPGGIYFSEKSKLPIYFGYGIYVVKVSIPDDAQVYIEKDKFKADKIILNLNNKILIENLNEWNNYDFCLNCVKTHGSALYYVKKQTLEICMEAVQQNGNALEYVKEQTLEICMAAVKQNPSALGYIKN
jgi:hypothetical protein